MTEELPRVLPKPLGTNAAFNRPHLIGEDTRLIITPEKSNLKKIKSTKDFQNGKDTLMLPSGVLTAEPEHGTAHDSGLKPASSGLVPTKLSALATDPTLDVTPEKLKAVLKSQVSKTTGEYQSKAKTSRVRFNVPVNETENEDANQSETLEARHADIADSKDHCKHESESFVKRAALYTQRNPLADITTDSSSLESSEQVTTAGESSMSTSQDSSFFQRKSSHTENSEKSSHSIDPPPLPHVKLKTIQKQKVQPSKHTKKSKGVNARIVIIKPDEKQSKVVDQATRPKQSVFSEKGDKSKQPFLKKNSSTQKHEHTVRYAVDCVAENSLSEATYNSTLSLGQKLQELRTDEFDAKGAVRKKMEESERFRMYVAEKTAEATNIDPEQTVYQNLVSVAVPDGQLLSNSAKWKRLNHKPHKAKESSFSEPDIWNFYNPDDLYKAEPEYGFAESIKKPKNDCGLQIRPCQPRCGLSPINAAEKLDSHEQLWSGAWGKLLPREADRVDFLS